MARKVKQAVRLPSGKYAWRGRAVSFSKIPKREQARFRSSWAKKAARTVRRETKKRRAEIVVVRGSMDRHAATTFTADRLEGQKIRDVLEAIREAKRAQEPDANRGSWLARIEWPDDERSEEGRPFTTTVSVSPRNLEHSDWADEMEDFLDEVEAAPEFLDRQKSGAAGRANVTSIEWAVWHGL